MMDRNEEDAEVLGVTDETMEERKDSITDDEEPVVAVVATREIVVAAIVPDLMAEVRRLKDLQDRIESHSQAWYSMESAMSNLRSAAGHLL